MAKIVLDARAGVLAGELSERCRLSGVSFVLAATIQEPFGDKTLGTVWDQQQSRLRGEFELIPASDERILEALNGGDALVTNSVVLAEKAIEIGVAVFHHNGWQYDKWFAVEVAGAQKARHIAEEAAVYRALFAVKPPTAATFSRLVASISTVVPQLTRSTRVKPLYGSRLLVDADAFPIASVLAAARTHDMPVLAAHNKVRNIRKTFLCTDPTEPQDGSRFWIKEVIVPVKKNAADDVIAAEVRSGDLVFTADIGLTIRCLKVGASVIDQNAARYYPHDLGDGLKAELAFRMIHKDRNAAALACYEGVNRKYAILDAAETMLCDASWRTGHTRPLPRLFDYTLPLSFMPSAPRALARA